MFEVPTQLDSEERENDGEEKGGQIMPEIFLNPSKIQVRRDSLTHSKQLPAKTEVFWE